MNKTLILEFDDLHWKQPENCLDTIKRYVQKYPKIKLSFFTTPCHSQLPLSYNPEWCLEINDLIKSNNIRIAVHGLYHNQEEFKYLDDNRSIMFFKLAEKEFNQAGIPFIKVFRGPHWGICQHTYDALKYEGYSHIYTHEDYRDLAEKNKTRIKNIFYNWNLKDEAPNDNLLIGHGHTFNVCSNGIAQTFDKVCAFIDKYNPEFKFVNEI